MGKYESNKNYIVYRSSVKFMHSFKPEEQLIVQKRWGRGGAIKKLSPKLHNKYKLP